MPLKFVLRMPSIHWANVIHHSLSELRGWVEGEIVYYIRSQMVFLSPPARFYRRGGSSKTWKLNATSSMKPRQSAAISSVFLISPELWELYSRPSIMYLMPMSHLSTMTPSHEGRERV